MLLHRGKIRFNNLFVTSPITKWKIIFHSFCLDLLSIKIGQLIGLLQTFKTRGLKTCQLLPLQVASSVM